MTVYTIVFNDVQQNVIFTYQIGNDRVNVKEDVRGKGLLFIVDENMNWCDFSGGLFVSAYENLKLTCPSPWQFHS